MTKKTKLLQTRIEPELEKMIDEYSRTHPEETQSDMIRNAVTEYIHKKKPLKSQLEQVGEMLDNMKEEILNTMEENFKLLGLQKPIKKHREERTKKPASFNQFVNQTTGEN